MVSKRAREIIEREMPGARIVEDHEIERSPLPPGVVKAPKYGHPKQTTMPERPVAATEQEHADEEGDVVIVQIERPQKSSSTLPAHLRRRTLIIDETSGNIIGESG